MKSRVSRALSAALVGFMVVIGTGGVQSGWIGSWEGDLQNPQGVEPIRLELDIRQVLGEIRIHARDSCGSVCDLGEGDLECDESELCFFYRIPQGSGWPEWIYILLELEENRMTGTWEDENGIRSEIRMRRIHRPAVTDPGAGQLPT